MEDMYSRTIVHPLPTEPPLVRRFPFSAEWFGPVHTTFLGGKDQQPLANEVGIDADWSIACDVNASPTVARAAQDLQMFLDVAMGIRLPICSKTSPSNANTIALALAAGYEREASSIDVRPSIVRLEASDAAGVFQGVVYLEYLMKLRRAPCLPRGVIEHRPIFKTRIFRSILSPYSCDELMLDDAYYNEGILNHLAHEGFNAIWLHGQLRDLVPPSVFPELGAGWQDRQRRLNNLIRRAADYGMRVYIYFTEPLSFHRDHPFWRSHPEVAGQPWNQFVALCTSTAAVKEWLEQSYRCLFELAPGLGGVILITASEHHAHCYCHTRSQAEMKCPRCRERTPQEVIGEILAIDERAIHAVAPEAEIIAWNWSWNWYEPDPQVGLLKLVPEGVTIMGDVDRGGSFTLFGKQYYNDEYSNIYVGPSDRFKGVARWCREHGRPVYGKTQISTTHEAATVPFMPLVQNVARKYDGLREEGCTGLMEVWNFGSFITPITAIANRFSWEPLPDSIDAAAREVATLYYGENVADLVVRAWNQFCEAAKTYPLSIPALYMQPLNRGPAFPLFFDPVDEPTPASWLDMPVMNHRPEDWIKPPFDADTYVRGFTEMLKGWRKALATLKEGAALVEPEYQHAYDRDLAVAECMEVLIRANLNVTRFALARDRLWKGVSKKEGLALLDDMEAICREQLELIDSIRQILQRDSRLGFHGEAYTYLIEDTSLDRASAAARDILRTRIPDWRRRLDPTATVASDFA